MYAILTLSNLPCVKHYTFLNNHSLETKVNLVDCWNVFNIFLLSYLVSIHRDSEVAFNDPFKIVGIWIALEDVTVENGCLWFIYTWFTYGWVYFLYIGLQRIEWNCLETAKRRWIRNLNQQEFNEGKKFIYSGEEENFDESALVPIEVKAGREYH